MSEETGKGEGVARVEMVPKSKSKWWRIVIEKTVLSIYPKGSYADCLLDCEELNESLAPMSRKAALCERMAEAIRRYKGCRYDEDPGQYITGLDDLLEEFDREAKK